MDELSGGRRQSRYCGFGLALAELSAEESADFAAALRDPVFTDAEVSRVLTRRSGVRVGKDTVGRHRRGECTCV
jgi:hypothetical protein